MSATAGFDVVAEIGAGILLDAIRAAGPFARVRLNPPFELREEFDYSHLGLGRGVAYTIVTGVDLTLERERDARLAMTFAGSCVENDDRAGFSVYGLAGTVSVVLPLKLIDGDGAGASTIGFDPAEATVTVDFTPGARSAIAAAWGAAGFPGDGAPLLASEAAAAVRKLLGDAPKVIPGSPVRVIPGVDGHLRPAPQFERLELRNLGTGAIGLFGSFRVADHDRGDPATLDARPLPPGQNVRLTIAAAAFRNLVFCPGVAAKLGVPAASVPGPCGGGGPVPYADGRVDWIEDRFEPGAVVVSGQVSKSDDCVKRATQTFSVRFPVGIADGRPVIGPGVPSFGEPEAEFDWYCEVAAVALFNVLGFAIIAIGREILEDLAADAVAAAVDALLVNFLGGAFPSLPQAAFSSVELTPESIALVGVVRFSIPPPDPPRLELRTQVRLGASAGGIRDAILAPNPQVIALGPMRIRKRCVDGEYPVNERFTRFDAWAWLETYLIPRPLRLTIVLETWASSPLPAPTMLGSQSLPAFGSGEASLPAECAFPLPLPDGTEVVRPVTVPYQTARRWIFLSNTPTDGSYALRLRIGVANDAGLNETVGADIAFPGDEIEILGPYSADLARCVNDIVERAGGFAHATESPPWGPHQHPSPDELRALVTRFRRSGNPEMADLAPYVALADRGAIRSAELAGSGESVKILDFAVAGAATDG